MQMVNNKYVAIIRLLSLYIRDVKYDYEYFLSCVNLYYERVRCLF